MTTKALEKMMLVAMWWNRYVFCEERTRQGIGCKGCPYDKVDMCDKASTEFVLESAGKAFKEYFEEINCLNIKIKFKKE